MSGLVTKQVSVLRLSMCIVVATYLNWPLYMLARKLNLLNHISAINSLYHLISLSLNCMNSCSYRIQEPLQDPNLSLLHAGDTR